MFVSFVGSLNTLEDSNLRVDVSRCTVIADWFALAVHLQTKTRSFRATGQQQRNNELKK